MTVSVAQLAARQIRLWEALRSAHPEPPQTPARRPSVTLSRETGVGAPELAARIAKRLNYSVWEHEVLDFMANTVGVRRQLIESLEEQRQSAVERWVDGALHGHLVDNTDYARALIHVLRALGEQGGVVIVGRGGSFVLPPESTVRVRIVAPLEWRALQFKRKGESLDDARKRLAAEDDRRVEFVKRTVRSDPRDPTAYDLVLNAERLSPMYQERLILEAVHARF
jgi:cytidylate kinase